MKRCNCFMKKVFGNKMLILGIIFFSMLIFNMLVPIICDDYVYLYIFNTKKRVTNIFDVFYSEYLHYFNWGGRVLAHSIAQTFLMFPKIIFNICNSLIYTLEIYLMYLIAKNKRKDNYFYLLIIHVILWLLGCSFGEVNFWLVGSCNYLWTSVIILLFIYQYIRDSKSSSKNRIILNAILGFLAGMCNENFSCAMIVMIFLFIVFLKKRSRADIVGLIFAVLGYFFLALAPGNFIRFTEHGGSFSIVTLLLRALFIIKTFWVIYLAFIFFKFIYFKKVGFKKELVIYSIGILCCAFWMIISPDFSIRALTGCTLFLTICIIYMLFDLNFKKKYFLLIIIPFMFSYITSIMDVFSLHSYWNDFEAKVKNVENKDKKEIVVPIFSSKNSHIPGSFDLVLIECDKKAWYNKYLSLYYGVDSVVGVGGCDKNK